MRFQTFKEFWPFYLGEHGQPTNRWLHFAGSTFSLGWAAAALATRRPALALGAVVNGYAFAWVGHFFVEKNKPATFTYPLWSLLGDWKMWGLMLTGRLNQEMARQGVAVSAPHTAHPH